MTENDSKKKLLLEYFGVEVIDYTIIGSTYEQKYYDAIKSVIANRKT